MSALALATSACGGIDPAPIAIAAIVTGHILAGPLQTLRVGQAVIAPAVIREPSTATSQADLDAARQHEVEAEAVAAHLFLVKAVAHRGPTHVFPPAQGRSAQGRSAQGTSAQRRPAQRRSGDAIAAYATQYVGIVPYSTGASPAAGFECDGFTQWVYAAFGVSLPRGVDDQAALGVEVSRASARAGDLVVYPGEHIGVYDGRGGIIDSPDWGRFVSHRAVWGNPVYIRIP